MPFDPSGLEEFHRQVRERIDRGEPGYAQGTIGGHVVSLHPHPTVPGLSTITTTSTFLTYREARDKLIDGTADGTAVASRGTFTRDDYEDRARYYERGYLLSEASDEDRAFAARLRQYAAQLG